MGLVVLMFFFGVAAVMGLYYAVTKLPGLMAQRKLDARLQELSVPFEDEKEGEKLLVKAQHVGPLPAIDRFFAGTTRGSAFGRWIDQSGTKASVSGVLVVGLICAVLMGLVAAMVTRAPWALPVGAMLGFALPILVLKVKRTRRMRTFEEQFPEALDLIARALKAGHAFATGLKMAADELPEPVGPEFRKTFDEQNYGLPMKDALDNLAHRIPILDVRFFVTAVLIQRETGGNLSEVLGKIASLMRERSALKGEIRTLTAESKLSARILGALPFVVFGAVSVLNPGFMKPMMATTYGPWVFFGATLSVAFGYWIMMQIADIEI